MPTMETAIWTRDEWKKARADKAKNGVAVPQGAAKVSIGDALDKFHKANAKGIQQGNVAAAQLKKDLVTYLSAVKTKYPKWHKRVENQIGVVDGYLQTVSNVAKAAKAYPAQYKTAIEDVRKLHRTYESTKAFDKAETKAAEKSCQALVESVMLLPYYSNNITTKTAETFRRVVNSVVGMPWTKDKLDQVSTWVTTLPGSL